MPQHSTHRSPTQDAAAPVDTRSAGVARLAKLEALRGFAAMYVVIHHTLPYDIQLGGFNVGMAWRFGQEAVILFFLLSGFVIKYSFETGSNKQFGYYFAKRFYRIYIPLIVVFVLGYFANSYNAGHWVEADGVLLLGNLLMLQGFDRVTPGVPFTTWMGNEPLWSLSFEWWFYMLFYPLTRYLKKPVLRNALVSVVAILAALAYIVWPLFVARILMYLAIWWSGVMLAEAYLKGTHRQLITFVTPVILLSLIASLMLVNVMVQRKAGHTISFGLYPVLELRHMGFATVVMASAWLWQTLQWRGFQTLFGPFLVFAPISYAVYIAHFHLFTNATYLAFIGNIWLEWFLYLGVTLAFSWALEIRLYPTVRRWLTMQVAALKTRAT